MHKHALLGTVVKPLTTLLATTALLLACGADDRCPGDGVEYDARYAVCAPVEQSAEVDAGKKLGADGDAAAALEDGSTGGGSVESLEFGAACSDDSDCGPGVCVNEPLMLGCTQSDCNPGEANAGACPDDWMCLADPTTGKSGCVKF